MADLSATAPTGPELILPPTRSAGTAVASFAAASLVLLLMLALDFDSAVPGAAKVAVALLGALFSGTLCVVGVTLMRGHGALLLDVAAQRVGLGVTRHGDTWWVPLSEVLGLAVVPQAAAGATTIERWLLVLGLSERPEVVLAESDDRGAILGIRETLAARLTISELPEDRRAMTRPLVPRAEYFAVARGAALQGLLAVFGSSLIAVGVIALSEVQREPVVGFIFAPILVVMGVVLLAVPLIKRFARESLSFDGQRWTHAFTFARWRWAERTVRGTAPLFRLRLLGMRGGVLELIGEDGVLVMAAGATAHSRIDLEAVAGIPGRFAEPG